MCFNGSAQGGFLTFYIGSEPIIIPIANGDPSQVVAQKLRTAINASQPAQLGGVSAISLPDPACVGLANPNGLFLGIQIRDYGLNQVGQAIPAISWQFLAFMAAVLGGCGFLALRQAP